MKLINLNASVITGIAILVMIFLVTATQAFGDYELRSTIDSGGGVSSGGH